MASTKSSAFPVILGGFVIFLIACGGAYFVLGPGAEQPAEKPKDPNVIEWEADFPGHEYVGRKPEKTASGMLYMDLTEGDGPTPPSSTSTVRVHYTGWLRNGKKFDSSYDRNAPAEFALNKVIPGWTEGVGSMKVGGKRKLIIPYKLGYGEKGEPPNIPPKATLVFDVELLSIVKP
jgi:FKBP-type peptidyl-prolyl cis-trans isomerase